jgi:PIN domain nuclease of toxin-antitoxin system
MIVGVADTHTIIWYFASDPRLSATAQNFLLNASNAGNYVAISSITLIEMVYLIEKGRIPAIRFTQLIQANTGITEIPIDAAIARTLTAVDVTKVPDMPDRIIAATALHLQVPVLSKDRKIQHSGITTIW